MSIITMSIPITKATVVPILKEMATHGYIRVTESYKFRGLDVPRFTEAIIRAGVNIRYDDNDRLCAIFPVKEWMNNDYQPAPKAAPVKASGCNSIW